MGDGGLSMVNPLISTVAAAATVGALLAAWFERQRVEDRASTLARDDHLASVGLSAERHFLADVALTVSCVFLFAIALATATSALLSCR